MMLSIHLLSLTNSTTRSCRPHIDPFPLSLSPLPLHDRPRSTLSADHFQPNSGIIFIDLSPRPVHSHHVIDRGYNGIGARFRQSLIEYCQIFFQAILLLYPSFPSRTNVTNPMWRYLLTLIRKIWIVSINFSKESYYIYLSFRSRTYKRNQSYVTSFLNSVDS